MKNINKGFTLIELLIVIAIIGILASVVIVSLGDQTGKASTAKLQSELSQVSSVATAHYSNNGNSYIGLCGVDASGAIIASNAPTLVAIMASINATTSPNHTSLCAASTTAWAFTANVKADSRSAIINEYDYCIDSVSGLVKKPVKTDNSDASAAPSDAYTVNTNVCVAP